MISAIVLAAGESRRMGKNKLLLQFGTESVIEHIISTLLKSNVDQTIVVVGYAASVIRKHLQDFPVTIIENSQHESGMFSSIRAGVLGIKPETAAFLLVLGDQPQIDVALVNHLIDRYKAAEKPILIPTHGGKGGHPVIVSAQFRDAVLHGSDKHGLRGIFECNADSIARVEVPYPAVLRDMDTPQDYENALRALESGPIRGNS